MSLQYSITPLMDGVLRTLVDDIMLRLFVLLNRHHPAAIDSTLATKHGLHEVGT